VQQAREKRFVGIQFGSGARDHVRWQMLLRSARSGSLP
jgi:hypothetical protein